MRRTKLLNHGFTKIWHLPHLWLNVRTATLRSKSIVKSSVTRLDDFWKILVTSFQAKVAKLFGDFLGNLENINFLSKSFRGYFCATFEKFGLFFIPTSGHTG